MNKKSINSRSDFHLKVINEIGNLINESSDLSQILQKVVSKIASALNFEVVSIYLFDETIDKLILRSTYGLKYDSNNPIMLSKEEGLTGEVYNNKITLIAKPASKHPLFKYFPESGEKKYESYIGTPIIIKNKCLGVLTGQASIEYTITTAEETFFNIISGRLAGFLEVANRLEKLNKSSSVKEKVNALQGKGVSGGAAFGKAYVINEYFDKYSFNENRLVDSENELKKLKDAFIKVELGIQATINEINKEEIFKDAEVNIFKAHLLILQSNTFFNNIKKRIESNSIMAEKAVLDEISTIVSHFENHSEIYLRDKAIDFKDIGTKLLECIISNDDEKINESLNMDEKEKFTSSSFDKREFNIEPGSIVVARHIGPSILNTLRKYKISGIVTEEGGDTSHTSILARSLEIPAVSSIEGVLQKINNGQNLLLDGKTGFLFVEPDAALMKEYEKIILHQKTIRELLEKESIDDRATSIPVDISANIAFPQDIEKVKQYKMKDIGLFRTEFSYLKYSSFPDLIQQVKEFKTMSDEFKGRITVRTLDIGADKNLPYLKMAYEQNPLLGLRSIRFSMENLNVFKEQITAILTAHKISNNFRILLPLVTQTWEVKTSIEIIEECANKLHINKNNLPDIGIMVEVPSIIFELKNYIEMIDFVSVGTNDFVQYLLGVDRESNSVGHLYSYYHPGVIYALKKIVDDTKKLNIELSVCGEMAGTPKGALILLALGFTKFSVIPSRAPIISHLCKNINYNLFKKIKKTILNSVNEKDIKQFLSEMISKMDPLLLEIN